MTTSPRGLADPVIADLASNRDVVAGMLSIHGGGGRRSANLRVRTGPQGSFHVKRAETPFDIQLLQHERRTLERLGGADSPIRDLVPEAVASAGGEGALVTLMIGDGRTLWDLHHPDAVPDAATAAALGRAIARIHELSAESQEHTPGGGMPAVLGLADTWVSDLAQLSIAEIEALGAAQRAGTCDLLIELARDWSRSCLIHGDVRPGNVLVDKSSPGEVRLVDWEFASRGDPCWDLGSLVGHELHLWLDSIPRDVGGPSPAAARRPLAIVAAFARAAWIGYAEAGGVAARDSRGLVRTVRYAGAALVDIALALGRQSDELTRGQVLHLQLGHNVLADPVAAAARLLGMPAAEFPT